MRAVPVVGMVGGGQLARMTHQAAIGLGQSLLVMAASEGEAAAQVSPNTVIGQHTDLQALRSFAKRASVLTFDHEHVPAEHLRTLAAEGVAVRPGPEALRYAQDKWAMRTRLAELGMPMPAFAGVTSVADVLAFAGEHDWPCVLKAARGGYDGRGVWVLDSEAEARELVPELLAAGTPLIVETHVEMRRELAALVARSPFGQAAAWPVVETVQRHGINVEVLAPAPALDEDLAVRAQRLAIRVAEALGVTGLLAVELFDTRDGVLVNELAMRPHNSGHWSIEGARTSQFEQHLRAVLDYPLGSTELTAPHIVSANVLGASEPELSVDERMHHLFARFPAAKVHYYGKAERPGRKLGHVTTLGADLEGLRRDARLAADYLAAGRWSDGFSAHGTGGTR